MMKKNNILVLGDVNNGGEWISTIRLIKEIRKYDGKFQFHLIAFTNGAKLQNPEIFSTITLIPYAKANPPFSFFLKLIKNIHNIRKALKNINSLKTEFTIIFTTHYLFVIALLSMMIFRHIPIVYEFQGIRSLVHMNWMTINYREIVVKFLERLALMYSTIIITPSLFGRKYIISMLGLFARFKKIRFVENFCPSEYYYHYDSVQLNMYKRKLSLPLKNQFLLYSGRIAPNKGLPNLIEAFKMFLRTNPKVILIIAYSKSDEDKNLTKILKDDISKYHLEGKVLFIADSPPARLMALYQMSLLTIRPSVFEVSPVVMFESLASGTPFMGTDVGNINEIISQIDKKLILKNDLPQTINNALQKYFRLSPSAIQKIKNKSYRLSKNLNHKTSTRQLISVFHSLIS